MITNKDDLRRYLEEDKNALQISRNKPKFLGDEIWRFQIALRKHEYYNNQITNKLLELAWVVRIYKTILCHYWHVKHKILGVLLGFSIPIHTIEEGLCIYHYGSIVIGRNAKIGKRCSIHNNVNIGQHHSLKETPVIGDDCYIGPGAKLFGNIILGNNVSIGANAVVNKSFDEDNIVLVGIPAKIIKYK